MFAMLLGSATRQRETLLMPSLVSKFLLRAVLLAPGWIYILGSWLLCAFRNAEECSRLRYWRAGVICFPFDSARVYSLLVECVFRVTIGGGGGGRILIKNS